MVGRPRKEPPPDAAQRIRELASEGHRKIGIANMLGVSYLTFDRWLKEHSELNEQYELGRERERHVLTDVLYRRALAGDSIAAMFLLKARHGYRDNGDAPDAGGSRINISFTLPGALPMSALPVIEHGNAVPIPVAIPAQGDDDP